MDPDNQTPINPISTPEPKLEPKPESKINWRFLIAVPVVFIFTLFVIYLFLSTTKIEGSLFYSNIANVKLMIPGGWEIDNTSNINLPVGFKEPAFALKKPGSACIIVKAEWDPDISNSIKQISRADRIFSDWTQFDGSWYIASTTDSAKYSYSSDARQYLNGEFRVSNGLRSGPFLLFMTNGKAVPNNCNDDFDEMLKTVEPYYEMVNLDSSSSGILVTEKVWDDNRYSEVEKSYEHLVFIADGSKERYEIMRIPPGTWTESFFVLDNNLYFPVNSYKSSSTEEAWQFDSAIYSLNPFSKKLSIVSGTATTNSYISSLFIRDSIAYYLIGDSDLARCLESYYPCPAELYSIPLMGGDSILVASSSLGGWILGYVPDEKAFYLGQRWGDAGCASASFSKIVNSREESIVKFDGCYGADEADLIAYQQTQDKIDEIVKKAGASKILTKAIHIDGGILKPTIDDISSYASFYFDKK